jgi:hypothetical protein
MRLMRVLSTAYEILEVPPFKSFLWLLLNRYALLKWPKRGPWPTCAIENLPSNACEPDSIIARMSHAEINRPFSSQNGLIFMELK